METEIETVQVCGIYHLEDEVVAYVSDEEATGYGVFIIHLGGFRGLRDFRCLQDFKEKKDALFYAKVLAGAAQCEMDDCTFSDLEV